MSSPTPSAASASPRRRRLTLRRRLMFGAILVVVSALLGLVAVELYLRATTPPALAVVTELQGMFRLEPDGTVLTTPGWVGRQTVEGRTSEVRLNRLGMRGPDLPTPKPAGQQRVLVLGDSFVWGYGVEAAEALPARLEVCLASEGHEIRVGNAGAPSYGPKKALATLRRVRDDFAPDVVVLCIFVGNDFDDDTRVAETVIDGFRADGPMARLLDSSWRARTALRFRTAFLLERFLDENLPSLAMDRSALVPDPRELAAAAILPPPAERQSGVFMDRRDATRQVEAVLDSLRTTVAAIEVEAAPAPVLVVVIPTATHCLPGRYDPALRNSGLVPADFSRGLVGRRIADALAPHGVRTVDLCAALIESDDPVADWQPIGLHFSVIGNQHAAGLIAPVVRELLASVR